MNIYKNGLTDGERISYVIKHFEILVFFLLESVENKKQFENSSKDLASF